MRDLSSMVDGFENKAMLVLMGDENAREGKAGELLVVAANGSRGDSQLLENADDVTKWNALRGNGMVGQDPVG